MSNDNNDARGPLSPNPQRNAVTNEALDGTLDALRPEMVPHLFRRAVVRGLVTPADGQPGPPVSGQPEPPVSGQPGPPVSGQPEPPVSGQPEPPVSGQPGPPVSGQVATPAVSSVPVDEEDWTPNPATISHGFVSSSIPPVAPIDDWSEYSVSMPTPAVAPTPGTNQPPAVAVTGCEYATPSASTSSLPRGPTEPGSSFQDRRFLIGPSVSNSGSNISQRGGGTNSLRPQAFGNAPAQHNPRLGNPRQQAFANAPAQHNPRFGYPQPSSSRTFHQSNCRFAYSGGPRFASSNPQPNFDAAGPSGSFNSSRGGGSNAFGTSKPYVKLLLPYTKAAINAHEPTLERGRYEAYRGTSPASGSQLFGSPTPNAKIRKMELHPLHVLIIDTDNVKQKLAWTTFEGILPQLKAADSFSITCASVDDACIRKMPGWTSFLKPVKCFTMDGKVTVTLVKKVFSRLPKTLKSLTFLPNGVVIEMAAIDALNFVPKSVQYLTFDTLCFKEGDLVTTVAMLPEKKDTLFERLILFGRRFPHRGTYDAFFNRLGRICNPGASVTLFTSNAPNDAVIGPMFDWGFAPAYHHRRTFGRLFQMYHLAAAQRILIGFSCPVVSNEDSEEDPYF